MNKTTIVEFFKGNAEFDPELRERIKTNFIETGRGFNEDADRKFIDTYTAAWKEIVGNLKPNLQKLKEDSINISPESALSRWLLTTMVKGFKSAPEISYPLFRLTSEILEKNGLFFSNDAENYAWVYSIGRSKDFGQFQSLLQTSKLLYDAVGAHEVKEALSLLKQIKAAPALNTYNSTISSEFRVFFCESLKSNAYQFIFDYPEVKSMLESMPGMIENILPPMYMDSFKHAQTAANGAERKKLIDSYINATGPDDNLSM